MILTKNKLGILLLVGLVFLNVHVASAAPGTMQYASFGGQMAESLYITQPICGQSGNPGIGSACDTTTLPGYCMGGGGGWAGCTNPALAGLMCYSAMYYACTPTPQAARCTFNGPLSWGAGCSGYASGVDVASGESATMGNTAMYYDGYISYACNNGSWSSGGSSCTLVPPPQPPCSLPWGGSIQSGESTSAFQSPSVPYGSSCSSETRYCTNGSLSGSYQYSSCSPEAPPQSPPPCSYSGPLSWGSGCSASGSWNNVPSGSTASTNNTASGYTGSITYACSSGSWSLSSQSCDPIPPPACTAPNSCGSPGSCYAPSGCNNACGSSLVNDCAGTCGGSATDYNGATAGCGSPPSYSCTPAWPNGYPANSSPWDGEETSGLTSDTGWSYGNPDTSTKCQYVCDPTYTWNGSSCVAPPASCSAPNSCGSPGSCYAPSGCNNACGSSLVNDCAGTCGGSATDYNGGTAGCGSPPPAAPSVTSFAPSSGIVSQGNATTLSWTSSNATSCVGTGFTAGGANGSASTGALSTPGTNNFQIICTGPGGSTPPSFTSVYVTVPSVSITASVPRVKSTGGPSTISWSSTDVSSCSVTGPGISSSALSGSQAVNITQQSKYTITCDGITNNVTVNIAPTIQEF